MAVFAQEVLVGNVGNIFEKRVVGKDNISVIDFSVAVTPRKRDGNDWVDGETYWMSCTAWGKTADNIADTFNKGDRVIVIGRIDMKDAWTNKDGEEKPARPYLNVEFAGLELSYYSATSNRPSSKGNYKSNKSSNNSSSRNNVKSANNNHNNEPAPKFSDSKKDDDLLDDDFDLDFSDFDDIEVEEPF